MPSPLPPGVLPAETDSAEATIAVGRQLAEGLGRGAVVALYGDLGAGKTHLVKGICSAFGVSPDDVNSPTYTLVHVYQGRDLVIYHIDAYRLNRLDEFFDLGYEDYFYGDGLCLVEWPEHVASLLPEDTLCLRLTHRGEHTRRIEELRSC